MAKCDDQLSKIKLERPKDDNIIKGANRQMLKEVSDVKYYKGHLKEIRF